MRIFPIVAAALVLASTGSATSPGGSVGTFPLVDRDTSDPILKPIFDAMKARGVGPLNIHRTIGHAPEVYRGVMALATALRAPGATSRTDRELVILRTTQVRSGEYEFIQHRRIGRSCGLTEDQVAHLADWRDQPFYSERQKAILEITDAMLEKGTIDDAILRRTEQLFTPREIVELTMTSAFYTAVVQFTRAVRVAPETAVTSYANC